MSDRAVPLPKFWPGDRVEVVDPFQEDAWDRGIVRDASWSAISEEVMYWVESDHTDWPFIVYEPNIRAIVESE